MAQAQMVRALVPKAPVQMRTGHGTPLRWTIKTVKVWALFPCLSEGKCRNGPVVFIYNFSYSYEFLLLEGKKKYIVFFLVNVHTLSLFYCSVMLFLRLSFYIISYF